MTTQSYFQRANVVFEVPTHPGDKPMHTVGMTGNQITETNRQYAHDLSEFRIYTNTAEALKKQILKAIPDTYITILQDAGHRCHRTRHIPSGPGYKSDGP